MENTIKVFNNTDVQKILGTINCKMCNEPKGIVITREAAMKYKAGAHIQVAFDYLSDDERELLLSGICGYCFDILFKKEE